MLLERTWCCPTCANSGSSRLRQIVTLAWTPGDRPEAFSRVFGQTCIELQYFGHVPYPWFAEPNAGVRKRVVLCAGSHLWMKSNGGCYGQYHWKPKRVGYLSAGRNHSSGIAHVSAGSKYDEQGPRASWIHESISGRFRMGTAGFGPEDAGRDQNSWPARATTANFEHAAGSDQPIGEYSSGGEGANHVPFSPGGRDAVGDKLCSKYAKKQHGCATKNHWESKPSCAEPSDSCSSTLKFFTNTLGCCLPLFVSADSKQIQLSAGTLGHTLRARGKRLRGVPTACTLPHRQHLLNDLRRKTFHLQLRRYDNGRNCAGLSGCVIIARYSNWEEVHSWLPINLSIFGKLPGRYLQREDVGACVLNLRYYRSSCVRCEAFNVNLPIPGSAVEVAFTEKRQRQVVLRIRYRNKRTRKLPTHNRAGIIPSPSV